MAKGKILVVDDEIYIVHILDFSLGMEGYEVITALDGEQAIEQARKEKPDLIVLDIMMPKLDGYETCKVLKAEKETRDIPVILLSAKAATSTRRSASKSEPTITSPSPSVRANWSSASTRSSDRPTRSACRLSFPKPIPRFGKPRSVLCGWLGGLAGLATNAPIAERPLAALRVETRVTTFDLVSTDPAHEPCLEGAAAFRIRIGIENSVDAVTLRMHEGDAESAGLGSRVGDDGIPVARGLLLRIPGKHEHLAGRRIAIGGEREVNGSLSAGGRARVFAAPGPGQG
jgi:CheY-like chemotaxis protein